VDTASFLNKHEFDFVHNWPTPHSKDLHVVERFRLIDGGTGMEATVTVDDPGTFNQPWSSTVRRQWVNRGRLLESICAENDEAFEKYFVNLREYPMPQAKYQTSEVVCAGAGYGSCCRPDRRRRPRRVAWNARTFFARIAAMAGMRSRDGWTAIALLRWAWRRPGVGPVRVPRKTVRLSGHRVLQFDRRHAPSDESVECGVQP
jgi:hypothetical protein